MNYNIIFKWNIIRIRKKNVKNIYLIKVRYNKSKACSKIWWEKSKTNNKKKIKYQI